VQTITLGNAEFEGRNNAYLLETTTETVLVDTGYDRDLTRRDLESGLERAGYEFEDVDSVLLTHWHYDHTGLAGAVQDAGGATVYAHQDDAPIVRQDIGAVDDFRARRFERFRQWGIPEPVREALRERLTEIDEAAGRPASVSALEDGDRLRFGDRTLEVFHTPGHTAGHACYVLDGAAFAGDVVLPVYTPNVGGGDVRLDDPLGRYVETLRRFVARDFDRAWPGHRGVIEAPAERARAILNHHRDRTERVVAAFEETGPADVWSVSEHLFGDLSGVHQIHGPGEAFAHLKHLERHGVVARAGRRYRLCEADPDLEALI